MGRHAVEMSAYDIEVNSQLDNGDDYQNPDVTLSLYHRLNPASREPPAHYAMLADIASRDSGL